MNRGAILMNFDPYQSLIGGSIMGMAILLLFAVNKRDRKTQSTKTVPNNWIGPIAFLVGAAAAPAAYFVFFDPTSSIRLSANTFVFFIACALVGLGLAALLGNDSRADRTTTSIVLMLQALVAFLMAATITVFAVS